MEKYFRLWYTNSYESNQNPNDMLAIPVHHGFIQDCCMHIRAEGPQLSTVDFDQVLDIHKQ